MRTLHAVLVVAVVFLGFSATPALGQPETVPTTIEEIKAALAALGDDVSGAPPAETTDETIKAYRLALEASNTAEASRTQAATFRALADAAPELVRQYRAELDTPPSVPEIVVPAGATLADLEQALAQATSDLAAAQSDLDTLRLETPRRSDRARAIPALITAAQADVDRLQTELDTPAPAEMAAARALARQTRIAAQLRAAQARVVELRAEADSYNSRSDLLPLRISRAERRVTQAQALVVAWQQAVGARRQQDARDAARQASERDLTQAEEIPALAPIAAQIRGLVDDLQGADAAPAKQERATRRLTEMRARLQERQRDEFEIRSRARNQASSAFGQMLQGTLRKLRDARPIRRQLESTQSTELDVTLRLEDVRAIVKVANDTGLALEAAREQLGEDAAAYEALAKRLIDQRRTLAQQSQVTLDALLDTLTELTTVYDEYLRTTESLQAFVKSRVFWVRSVPRDRLVPQAADFAFDIRWLADREAWRTALLASGHELIRAIDPPSAVRTTPRPVWHYLVLPLCSTVLIVMACVGRWRLIVRSRAPLPSTGRFQSNTMPGTFLKLGLTIAAAIPLPLAIWAVGAWLGSAAESFSSSPDSAIPSPIAVASGLNRAAYVLFGLSLLRGLIRRSGTGVTQFRWSETALAHFRFHLRWMMPVGVVIAATVQTFEVRADDLHTEALGRASLAVALLVAAFFQWRVFSPKRPFIGEYIKKHRRGLIDRSAWLWFPLMVATPILLAVATAAGYVYTALQIQRTIGNTYLIVLVVLVGQALVLRSLQLARRRIAIEAARARAAAAEAEAETARQSPNDPAPTKESEAAPEIDLTAISLQSRKVVQMVTVVVLTVGLYAVWNDVLPALKWFERLQVFPSLQYIDPDTEIAGMDAPAPVVSEQAEPSSGTSLPSGMMPSGSSTPAEESSAIAPLPSRVTVADIGLAVLLLVLTVSASRNLPGLLEITLLPHLPLDSATRYAIFSIARYLLIIVGVVAISKTLSIPWRSAQWLAAALTFGLAFGMQEIFANFVAGIIMLFEQPVRVGDTVTIGSVSGEVSRIRMRATTIVDWDNKELIIPNKTFITDQVINWTLHDPIMRVVIPVGIAYGSDTELAQKLLLKAAEECPHTIDAKPARALFLGFGDNSLNFSLRVFIDTITNLMSATSDIHFRIDRAFREAGIEISFPQRDLHIRSLDPAILERFGVTRADADPTQTTEDGAS